MPAGTKERRLESTKAAFSCVNQSGRCSMRRRIAHVSPAPWPVVAALSRPTTCDPPSFTMSSSNANTYCDTQDTPTEEEQKTSVSSAVVVVKPKSKNPET